MPHSCIPWLLLAAPLAYCLCAAAVPNLGRRREGPDAGPGGDAPLPARGEDRALGQLEAQVRTLNERLAGFDGRFQTLAKSNEQLYGLLKSCTTQLYQALSEIGQRKDQLASALAQQHGLEALNLAQQRELERNSARLRALEAEAESRARGTDSALRELAEVERALSVRVLELDGRAAAEQRESVERAGELAAAKQRCEDLEALARALSDELLEVRRVERELRQQALERRASEEEARSLERGLSTRVAGLEAELARRDEELRQQLEGGRARESRDCEREATQSARIGALEGDLARLEEQLRERASALEGLRNELAGSTARCDERARRCAELEQELRERSAAVESLRGELAGASARHEERTRRCTELEEELRLQVEEQRVSEQRAREVEQELTSRLRELEARAERREAELRERAATLEQLRAGLAREAGAEPELSRRSAELAGQLALGAEELQALRAECARLAEHGATLARELQGREQELAQARARIDDLECADARREAQHREELAFVDELAESRIAALLHGQAGGAPESLPPAYLAGMEKRDLGLALRGLLGGPAPLSISSMLRLGEHWNSRHEAWKSEPIGGEVVYLWAAAPFVRAGLEPEGASLLVVIAGLADGTRQLVAVEAGLRDSAGAWRAVLEGLVRRGVKVPRLVVAQDGLGLWPALAELGWSCAEQRCWDSRIEHVVEALPRWRQRKAGERLRAIAKAKTRARATKLKDAFTRLYRARNPEAVARLQSDWAQMLSLYSFPAPHWPQLRTATVVDSLLGALRLQTSLARPYPRTPNAQAILWKLLLVGARGLRKQNAPELLPAVAAAEPCTDGIVGKRARGRAA